MFDELLTMSFLANSVGEATELRMASLAWAEDWMKRWCETMPHSNKKHWPASLCRKDIWEMYTENMLKENKEFYSYSAFLKLLREYFPNHSKANANTDFKCNVCLQLHTDIVFTRHRNREGKFDGALRQLIIDRDIHIKLSDQQRGKKAKHDAKAVTWPEKYASWILDGMDQTKLLLPNFSGRKDLFSLIGMLRARYL